MASIQISIADPCHENWNNMLPEEQGRFCLSCQKTVVDFTSMSDGQVFDYFRNYKGSTCGQFTPQQLNRDIAKPKTHSIGRWKYFWQILLPTVFAFHKAEGQMLKGKVAPRTVCKADTIQPESMVMGKIAMLSNRKEPTYKLQGTVLDEKHNPIPFATIISQGGKGIVTDSTGNFLIEIPPDKILTVSSVGYETKTILYDSLKTMALKRVDEITNIIVVETSIQLKPTTTSLQDVVVVGGGVQSRLTGRVGGISIIGRRTIFSAAKLVKPSTDLPALKIFPNPIKKGQSFQVSLQVNKIGSYVFRIVDAAGKTMLEEKRSISSKSQTETIDGNALQQAGIYFLQISNPADKKGKGIIGKIVVQ